MNLGLSFVPWRPYLSSTIGIKCYIGDLVSYPEGPGYLVPWILGPSELIIIHCKQQAGRKWPKVMERRRKRQILDGPGSRSLNSACRRGSPWADGTVWAFDIFSAPRTKRKQTNQKTKQGRISNVCQFMSVDENFFFSHILLNL